MKKLLIRIILIVILAIALPLNVYGSIDEKNQIINNEDIENIDNLIMEGDDELSFSKVFKEIITGEKGVLDFLLKPIEERLFLEIRECIFLLKPMLIAAILSAILKSLSTSFASKGVSELGFYVCYMVMIFVVIDMFRVASKIVVESGSLIGDILIGGMPIFYSLMTFSGEYSGAYLMGPIVASGGGLMTYLTSSVIVPLIGIAITVETVNNITERGMLNNLSNLIKKGVALGLKAIAIGFTFLLSLQKIGSNSTDRLAGRTIKAVVGAVPVVGDIISGALDGSLAFAGAVKGATAVTFIVIVIILSSIPILKLFVLMLMYKALAAVLEPIGEKRFIKCINSVGDYTGLMLGTLFTNISIFIFSIILLIGFY